MKDLEKLLEIISSLELKNEDSTVKNIFTTLIKETYDELHAELKSTKEELQRVKEDCKQAQEETFFYKALLNTLPNLIFVKNAQAEFIFFNDSYQQAFNAKFEDFEGKKVGDLEFLPKTDREIYQLQDEEMLNRSATIHYEKSFFFSDDKVHDSLYWSKGFLVPETGQKGLVGEIVDISEQKRLEQELATSLKQLQEINGYISKAYVTDFSTRLGNRYALNEALPDIIKEANEEGKPFAILIADLDNFKSVNDTYGHNVGDDVLVTFAKTFEATCRKTDLCIRYGGEEFLAILPSANKENAKAVAERVCKNFRELEILPDGKKATVSIGVTMFILEENITTCISRADKALYHQKGHGKDGVYVL